VVTIILDNQTTDYLRNQNQIAENPKQNIVLQSILTTPLKQEPQI